MQFVFLCSGQQLTIQLQWRRTLVLVLILEQFRHNFQYHANISAATTAKI